MKKLIFSFVSVLFLFSSAKIFAQQDEIQEIQKEFGKDKKELMSIGMDLKSSDSVKFWPIYAQYEKQRQKLGRDRILILTDYAENCQNLTNAKADELINKIFKNDAALAKLQQQYYTTIKTKMNALQAAKFLQIESYISTAIRSVLQEEIPFIGELDSMKTKQ